MQPSTEPATDAAEPRTVDITPDYAQLFDAYVKQIGPTARVVAQGMRKQATGQGLDHLSETDYIRARQDAELSLLNGLCFAINMAAQCMTTVEQVGRFRDATAGALAHVNDELTAFRVETDDA